MMSSPWCTLKWVTQTKPDAGKHSWVHNSLRRWSKALQALLSSLSQQGSLSALGYEGISWSWSLTYIFHWGKFCQSLKPLMLLEEGGKLHFHPIKLQARLDCRHAYMWAHFSVYKSHKTYSKDAFAVSHMQLGLLFIQSLKKDYNRFYLFFSLRLCIWPTCTTICCLSASLTEVGLLQGEAWRQLCWTLSPHCCEWESTFQN